MIVPAQRDVKLPFSCKYQRNGSSWDSCVFCIWPANVESGLSVSRGNVCQSLSHTGWMGKRELQELEGMARSTSALGTGASLLCVFTGEVKETKLPSGSLASLSCWKWSEDCPCEGHQGVFSMGEERQAVKYMGKYVSYNCRRTCLGLLFLLERFICLKPSKVKKAPLSFTTSWGKGGRVLLFPPLTPIWQVLVENFLFKIHHCNILLSPLWRAGHLQSLQRPLLRVKLLKFRCLSWVQPDLKTSSLQFLSQILKLEWFTVRAECISLIVEWN